MQQESSSQSTFAAIRDRLVNHSLLILAVLSLPALAASLARSTQTGWQLAMSIDIVLVILLWCLVVLRRALSTSVLGWSIVGFLFAIAIAGLISYGVSSESILLLVLMVVVATLFFGLRAGIALVIAAEVLLVLMAVMTTRHWLPLTVDFNRYDTAVTSWLTLIIGYGTFVSFMLVITNILYAALADALSNAQQHAQQLEALTYGLNEEITERKQAEAALRESEERFRLLVETVKEYAIFMLDVNGNVVSWNVGAERMKGYSPEEILGRSVAVFYPPEDAAQGLHVQELTMAAREGHHEVEGWRVRKDGSRFLADVVTTALYAPDGTVRGYSKITRDITERKQAEAALAHERDQARRYIDIAGVILVVIDSSECVTLINKKGSELLQYPQQEIIGHHWVDTFVPVRCRETVRTTYKQLMTGEIAQSEYENPILTKTGEERLIAWHNTVLRDDNGRIIGTLSSGEDITERKQAEEALRESERKARAIFDLSFELIGLLTPDGTLLEINQTALEFEGVQLSDVVGKPFWDTPWWSHSVEIQECLRAAVRTAATGELVRFEATNLAADGTIHTLDVSLKPVKDDEGRVILLIPEGRDISERKQAEEALKEADRAKDQFLMLLSHELKTPLTSILGWAQMAHDAPEISTEAIDIILRNANAERDMLERLLTLSRVLTGKLILRQQHIDLWQLTEQQVAHFQPAANTHRIMLTVDPPGAPLLAQADPKYLQQVICELLENAIRFTEDGGQVIVSGHREESHVFLAVHDTGRGIASEQLPLLLNPFRQLQREETEGGIGIGLALVKGIVELHGGGVRITSPGLGKGTTVTVELPYDNSSRTGDE